MTINRVNLPDCTDVENATLNRLLAKLDAKTPRNLLRACYYDGKRAIRQVGTIIPPQYYNLGIVLGWSAKAVDLLGRRTNLDAFVWPDGDLDSIGSTVVWEGNHLAAEFNSACTSSLIHAASFLIATKGDADGPPALIHTKDALNATGEWNPRLRRLDNLVSVNGWEKDQPVDLVLYLPNLTISATKADGAWQVMRSSHKLGMPAEPLVYRRRSGRDFGASRISRAVMSLHDQALRTVIRMEGHADVYSFPEMWLLGADESMFKNTDGTQKAAWQVMLGRIKAIPDDDEQTNPRADVKQFQASSPSPHLAQLNALAKMFAREAELPDTAVAITDMANPTSAEAYDASQHDLIAEAEGALDDWSPAVKRVYRVALALANGLNEIPPTWATITPKWRDPRYLSRAAQADAGMKQLTAVPWLAQTDVGLELLGLDEPQIKRALAEKRRATAAQTVANLAAAAQAVRTPPPGQQPPVSSAVAG